MSDADRYVVRLHGVSHRYGATLAADAVTLDIPAGCMVGLIGPDGVGKSSLLALVSGARQIQAGKVEVLGGDIGDSSAWRVGLSHVRAQPRERGFEDNGVNNTFSGRSQTWIADFVYKWAPNGNATERYLKLQGEYLWRRESGVLTYDVDVANVASDARFRQSGGYLQAVCPHRRGMLPAVRAWIEHLSEAFKGDWDQPI
mgnify:CR=1 FL=1